MPRNPKTNPAIQHARPARWIVLMCLPVFAISALPLAGCSTDQVFDSTRYWGDRLAGATLDADPGKD